MSSHSFNPAARLLEYGWWGHSRDNPPSRFQNEPCSPQWPQVSASMQRVTRLTTDNDHVQTVVDSTSLPSPGFPLCYSS